MSKDTKILFPADYGEIINNCDKVFSNDITPYLESQYEAHREANPNYLNNLLIAKNEALQTPYMAKMIEAMVWNPGSITIPLYEKLKHIDKWIELTKAEEVLKEQSKTYNEQIEAMNSRVTNWNNIIDKVMDTPPHKAERLTMRQIALIHAYEGNQITEANSNSIAEKHKHKSGHKLYQYYNYYQKPNNRRGAPKDPTLKTVQNKIDLITSVLPFLTGNNIALANDEIRILNNILDTLQ